jgi:hypothetical protein
MMPWYTIGWQKLDWMTSSIIEGNYKTFALTTMSISPYSFYVFATFRKGLSS